MPESTTGYNDKRIQIDKNEANLHTQEAGDNPLLLNSPILATRYAHESSKLVYSIEKNFYVTVKKVNAPAN